MKILAISDIHIRSTNVAKRSDDYEDTIFRKLTQILNNLEGVDVIVCGGDIYDSWRTSKRIVGKTIRLFRDINIPFLTVYGQHDQIFRSSNLENTPIGLLEAAGVINILNDAPFTIGNVDFYGSNFEQEIPKILDKSKINVLSIHRMVISDKKLWNQQEEYVTSKSLLDKYDFDLIVSGDNHQSFVNKSGSKVLINAGCIMRNSISLKDHKPRVIIYDTENPGEVESYYIDIEPFENIFDLEAEEYNNEKRSSLTELSDLLNNSDSIETDFKGIVLNDIKDESVGVNEIANEVFGDEEKKEEYSE